MSTTHPTLDRDARRAVRAELAVTCNGYGDWELMVARGERDQFLAAINTLQRIGELLDAIGWTEQDGEPDVQTVTVGAGLAGWAAGQADALAVALGEVDCDPEHVNDELDALAGLRTLAASS